MKFNKKNIRKIIVDGMEFGWRVHQYDWAADKVLFFYNTDGIQLGWIGVNYNIQITPKFVSSEIYRLGLKSAKEFK